MGVEEATLTSFNALELTTKRGHHQLWSVGWHAWRCGMHGPIVRARLLVEQTRESTPLAIVAGGLGLSGTGAHGYSTKQK
jgi:hypothetical protein